MGTGKEDVSTSPERGLLLVLPSPPLFDPLELSDPLERLSEFNPLHDTMSRIKSQTSFCTICVIPEVPSDKLFAPQSLLDIVGDVGP